MASWTGMKKAGIVPAFFIIDRSPVLQESARRQQWLLSALRHSKPPNRLRSQAYSRYVKPFPVMKSNKN
jgi:hypothetical protein